MPIERSTRETIKLFDLFYASVSEAQQARLQKALDVVRSAIDIFGLEGVCFSFNGGKDSTAVLHLLRIVIAKRVLETAELELSAAADGSSTGTIVTSPRNSFVSPELLSEQDLETRVHEHMHRVPVMFFDSPDQFPEEREFMEQCISRYQLNCHVYKCSFVEGIKDILDKLHVTGVYMGVRGGDPHTEDMEHLAPSSPGWPPFLRVNPILKWTYSDVWDFLCECRLEYCSLYDRGYTSLGNIYNTVPNPKLYRSGGDGEDGYYLAAYELEDGSTERCGRSK